VKLLELGASVTSEVMMGASSSGEWPGTGEGLHGGQQRRGLGESPPGGGLLPADYRLIAVDEAVHAALDRLHATHHRQELI
jgi:hypothetical protein